MFHCEVIDLSAVCANVVDFGDGDYAIAAACGGGNFVVADGFAYELAAVKVGDFFAVDDVEVDCVGLGLDWGCT